ncbi:MAG: ribbon-helix-helix protein, CopG family [Rhodocyclaceae bacterium]|nr:ribbon-helix-helix protein, CopG family [Rhodocyclaceae bacterium]MBX3667322.1 ribbon-helix-helix protein, CopG family [Rhodocyclaceae bacterium]
MQTTLTVRLSEKEAQDLQAICELTGKSRSDVVRAALHARIFRERLDALRAIAVPRAQAAGLLTEGDIFREAS